MLPRPHFDTIIYFMLNLKFREVKDIYGTAKVTGKFAPFSPRTFLCFLYPINEVDLKNVFNFKYNFISL